MAAVLLPQNLRSQHRIPVPDPIPDQPQKGWVRDVVTISGNRLLVRAPEKIVQAVAQLSLGNASGSCSGQMNASYKMYKERCALEALPKEVQSLAAAATSPQARADLERDVAFLRIRDHKWAPCTRALQENALEIYENGLKNKEEWEARIRMIELAAENADVFALSIVPVDPSIEQTLYFRNGFAYLEASKYGKTYTTTGDTTTTEQEDPDKPAPVLKGFVKPYPTFTSNLAAPDETPSMRCEVNRIEDIDKHLADIEPSLKERMHDIVEAFLVDQHASQLGTITLKPSERLVQRKLFVKPQLALG